jgi:ABC-type uncharacterized transport system fused permease/ATPase subunit
VAGPHACLVAHLLVIDEALDALDDDTPNRVLRLLNDELKDASVNQCPETKSHFFTRVLHLVKDPQGRIASCPISESLTHPPPNSISFQPKEISLVPVL